MATVLSLDLSCLHTPESGQVVRGSCRKGECGRQLRMRPQDRPRWRPAPRQWGSSSNSCHWASRAGRQGKCISPVTMYWESPEKAQPHIQPRDDSPGLLLLMLSSVIKEKLDVLQILQVWSAEQVARSLGVSVRMAGVSSSATPTLHPLTIYEAGPNPSSPQPQAGPLLPEAIRRLPPPPDPAHTWSPG